MVWKSESCCNYSILYFHSSICIWQKYRHAIQIENCTETDISSALENEGRYSQSVLLASGTWKIFSTQHYLEAFTNFDNVFCSVNLWMHWKYPLSKLQPITVNSKKHRLYKTVRDIFFSLKGFSWYPVKQRNAFAISTPTAQIGDELMFPLVHLLEKYTCNWEERKLAFDFFLTWYTWLVKFPSNHIWATSLHRKQAQSCQEAYMASCIWKYHYWGKI